MDPMFYQRRKQAAQRAPLEGDDLFTAAAKAEREAITGREAGARQAETTVPAATLDALTELMKRLAWNAGHLGVTVADLRHAADAEQLLPQSGGRRLSFLGAIAKRAGLVGTAQFRRSDVDGSNGNAHRVWLHPEHARGAA